MNYRQQLEHRLAMVMDDLNILKRFIKEQGLTEAFDKASHTSDSAWSNIINIEVACDLNDDVSLSWGLFE